MGIMITGPSGSGKSDLALRLIDRGATLISDDSINIVSVDQELILQSPETVQGKMEIRSLGILAFEFVNSVPLGLKVQLRQTGERFPMDRQTEVISGKTIPLISIDAFEQSAPIKVELALKRALEQRLKK